MKQISAHYDRVIEGIAFMFNTSAHAEVFPGRRTKNIGWEGRYQWAMKHQAGVKVFKDLEDFIANS